MLINKKEKKEHVILSILLFKQSKNKGSMNKIGSAEGEIPIVVIPVVVSTLGTVPKVLEKRPEELETRGGIEIIQTTVENKQNTQKSRRGGVLVA